MSLKPGQSLGQYTIIEPLGKGGMATVYRASQPSLSRQVAIKVLPEFFAEDPAFHERFRQEAMSIAKLRHPNILTVFDSGETDGVAYIVMELVDGGTLSSRLGKPLRIDETLRLITPIASALDYAHGRGMVHRDIKPGNILLSEDGTPILSDFGLARITSATDTTMPRLTATGTALGTPEYMAPEQIRNSGVGPPADVYALAVTLYEMLTGSVPHSADTPVSLIAKRLSEPIPPPRARNPDLLVAVQDVLLKGLADKPEDRFATAGRMLAALEAASRPAAVAAAPARAAATAQGNKSLKFGLLGGATAVLLGIAGYAWTHLTMSPPTAEPTDSQAPATTLPSPPPAATSAPVVSTPGPTPAAAPPAPGKPLTPPTTTGGAAAPRGKLLFSLATNPAAFARALPARQRTPGDSVIEKNGALEITIGSNQGVFVPLPVRGVRDFVAVLKYVAVEKSAWLNFRFHVSAAGEGQAVRLPTYMRLSPPAAGSQAQGPHQCCQPFDVLLTPHRQGAPSLLTGAPPLATPPAANEEQSITVSVTGPEIRVMSGGKEIARASDATFTSGGISLGFGAERGQTPSVVRVTGIDVFESPASSTPASSSTETVAPAGGAAMLPPHGRMVYALAPGAAALARAPQQRPEDSIRVVADGLELTAASEFGAQANLPLAGLSDFVAFMRFSVVSGKPLVVLRFHRSPPQAGGHVVQYPAYLKVVPTAPGNDMSPHKCCREFDVWNAPVNPAVDTLLTGPAPRMVPVPPGEEQTITVSVTGSLIVIRANGLEIARVTDSQSKGGAFSVQVLSRVRGQGPAIALLRLFQIYEAAPGR